MIKDAIEKLTRKINLSVEETKEVFNDIFDHKTTSAQTASFLTALKVKGETVEEIYGAATIARERAMRLSVKETFMGIDARDEQVLDTCGTGGSGVNKFNVSTAVSFVVAAHGIKVAKHGNRAMSSTCGSADVLEELGIKIDVSPKIMEEAIKKIGIGFLYAPLYHPALLEVAAIRKEIGIRTIFNILGPLCNPAGATHQLLGVYKKELVETMAVVLKKLGIKKALVVCGKDLKDEVSLTGETTAILVDKKKMKNLCIEPADFGLKKITAKCLEAKDARQSAKIILDVLDGKYGPAQDEVLANASCCFYILNKVSNLKDGVKLAKDIIDTGRAKDKFLKFKQFIDRQKKEASVLKKFSNS
ncbi:MAG: anthranilate phosphoribosyltransferase [Candidatus Omnitrophota bacterium]